MLLNVMVNFCMWGAVIVQCVCDFFASGANVDIHSWLGGKKYNAR